MDHDAMGAGEHGAQAGDAPGPNAYHALHAGADYMAELFEMQRAKKAAESAGLAVPPSNPDGSDEVAALRAARLAALQTAQARQARSRFGGGVKLIDVGDWQREVVEMSQSKDGTWVVVHLQHDPNPQCAAVRASLELLSCRHPAVSFVSVAAASMMPASQLHNLPAVFCYMEGKLHERLICRELCDPGTAPTPDEVEWKLAALGVLSTDLELEPLRAARPPRRVGQRAARDSNEDGGVEYTAADAAAVASRGGGGGRSSDDDVCDDDDDEDGGAGLGVD